MSGIGAWVPPDVVPCADGGCEPEVGSEKCVVLYSECNYKG